MNSGAIASLAVLKVNTDRGTDYIGAFVPFVAESLKRSTSEVISLSDLQVSLRRDFGLEIPQGPLRTVLDRAVRDGHAVRENRLYRRVQKGAPDGQFECDRARLLREEDALVGKLVDFTAKIVTTAWTPTQAENALLTYLADRGGSILAASADAMPLTVPSPASPGTDFVLNSFVVHLHASDAQGFEYLLAAVKGSVLSSVLYFDDLGSVGQHFNRLAVYLDTGILLRALGRLGPDQEVAARELLDLVRDLGGQLHCFRDTLEEVEGIHRFAARCIASSRGRRRPLWGATEYLVQQGYSVSDVELMVVHLESDLAGLSVTVRDRPAPTAAWTVDEAALESRLRTRVKYPTEEPLRHDLRALVAINNLRRGEPSSRIETSTAIFVTTNSSVARVARSFFRGHYGVKSFAPICIPDHQFATIAWLKRPLKAPDLPRKYVIADALAALNPPESLWQDYVREIVKLERSGRISTEDYYVLRYTRAAREALMGMTLGGSSPFLEGSVPEILSRARAAERADLEDALLRQSQAAAADAEASRLQSALERKRHGEDVDTILQRVADLESRLESASMSSQAERERRLRTYKSIADFLVSLPRNAFALLYLAVTALQAYAISPIQPLGLVPDSLPTSTVYLLGLVLVLVANAGLSIKGKGLHDWLATPERWCSRHLMTVMAAHLGDAGTAHQAT